MASPVHNPAQISDEVPRGSLEWVIAHLVAAKRSLSAIDGVWRANELVTNARSVLEESIVSSAQTLFIRRSISGQLRTLQRIRAWVGDIAEAGSSQFNTALQDLDDIDVRLLEVFEVLRVTAIEPQFQEEAETKKTLHDFVDEDGFENLKDSLRSLIDDVQASQTQFGNSIAAFDDDIKSVEATLQMNASVQVLNSPIPNLLSVLEAHASDMAGLLSSLVGHYDLCITAVKSTEGGGVAAQSITSELPTGVDVAKSLHSDSEPLTEAERQDLIDVIEKDSSEVDEAVQEIKEHLLDMEIQFGHVSAFSADISSLSQSTLAAFEQLEAVGQRLSQYTASAHAFLDKWEDDRAKIEESMSEMLYLREFYENFLQAYDDLILEVARRRKVQSKMESIIKQAMDDVGTLYEAELSAREAFRQDSGQHLPSDIWSGLLNPPAQYDFIHIDKERSHIPHLSKDVIERAKQRRGR